MGAHRPSPADERLTELVDRVEAEGTVEIEREGRIVARLVAAPDGPATKAPFDLAAYVELIEDMPVYQGDSVAEMRKEACF